MSRTYRVGIVGFAHMHVNHLSAVFGAHPQVEWAACADTEPDPPELKSAPHTRRWNRDYVMREQGIPRYCDDWQDMLKRESTDIVIVTCENGRHADVVEACAAAGVHTCVEKPMAAALSEGERMVRAGRKAGTTLAVNWPIAWSQEMRQAKALVDAGAIGKVLEIRWRGGHMGPLGSGVSHPGVEQDARELTDDDRSATWWHRSAPGGGVMLDYCCYGSMISAWLNDTGAEWAFGIKANLNSSWAEAEDNAFMLVRFPQSVSVLEGSWTTRHHGVATGPIIYGTEGTIVVGREGQSLRVEGTKGEASVAAPDPLPEGRANEAEELIHHLDTGEPLHPLLDEKLNLQAMAILDAGIRSAASGKQERVREPEFTS